MPGAKNFCFELQKSNFEVMKHVRHIASQKFIAIENLVIVNKLVFGAFWFCFPIWKQFNGFITYQSYSQMKQAKPVPKLVKTGVKTKTSENI